MPKDTKNNTAFVKPTAADPLLPASVSHTTRTRRAKSYSALNYEWAVYRSKGKTLSDYKRLPIFEKHSAYQSRVLAHGKTKQKVMSDTKKLKEAAAESRRIEKGFFNDINGFFSLFGVNVYNWFSGFIFESYFYKNIFFYYFVWVCFYVQEYTYVNFALYFPILDWITANLFFTWPVHLDLYFVRFSLSLFLTIFAIFAFFHYRLQSTSRFDLFLGVGQFFAFFGSIGLYHLTGFAPFLFVLVVCVVLFFLFTFFYFIPRHLIRFKLQPPLLLAPPCRPLILCLPLYRYRYPFPSAIVRNIHTARGLRRFTAFPFTTRVAGLARYNRFVAAVRIYNELKLPPAQPRTLSPPHSPSFAGMDVYFRENPYDYYENYLSAYFFRKEDNIRIREPQDEEEDYIKQEEDYSIAPGLLNNVTFFSSGFRIAARSLYGFHTSTDFDTFGAMHSAHFPLWQKQLLNDKYFELYMWLKNVAPLHGALPPISKYHKIYFTKAPVLASAAGPYAILTRLLSLFYRSVEFLFDRLTFRYFTAVNPNPNSLLEIYRQLALLTALLEKKTFRPSQDFLKATAKFSMSVDRYLDNCTLGGRKLGALSDHTLRFELIHFVGFFARLLSDQAKLLATRKNQGNKVLYCQITLRNLDKILLKLTL
jgi:hypothetical protein